MKIWLPKCGDAIRLTNDWTFMLHEEYRNRELWKLAFSSVLTNKYGASKLEPQSLLIPKNTELVFDRIYVRQGADDFASCTFIIKEHPSDDFVGERFWAKLEDVNNIECDTTTTDNPIGGFAKAGYKYALKAKKDPSLLTKSTKSKLSKEELESARTEIEMLCSKTSPFTMQKPALFNHIGTIVNSVIDNLHKIHTAHSGNSSYKFNRTGHEQFVRHAMNYDDWRHSKNKNWICVATRKNKDGSTSRDFSFMYSDSTRYDGFTVLSHGCKVIDISEFVVSED